MIGSPPATGERCFDGSPAAIAPRTPVGADRLRLAAGASVGLAGRLAGRLLQVAGHVAVARLLGPEAFGLYAIGWTLLRVSSLLAPLGLQQGVIRFGSSCWQRDPAALRGVVLQSLGLAACSATLAGAALFVAAPWLAGTLFDLPDLVPVIRGFVPAVVAAALLRVAAAATRVSQRVRYSALSEDLAQGLSQLLLVLTFLALGWGLGGAVAAGGLSLALGLLVALACLLPALPELRETRDVRFMPSGELLRFSAVASLAGFTTMVLPWTDRLIVPIFRPAADVGVYQAASQLTALFAIVLGAFGAVFAPMISRLHRDGDSSRLAELYATSTKWALYLSAPAFLVVFFAGDRLLAVLFGAEYARAGGVLALLALGQLANVATGVVGLMLTMTGHQRVWFAFAGTALVVNVALNVALIPAFGLVGAAIATAISLAVLFFSGLILVRRRLHCWPYDRRYVKGLTALIPVLVVLRSWSGVEGVSPLAALLVTALIAVAGFYGLLAMFGLEEEDRELVAALGRRLGSGAAR